MNIDTSGLLSLLSSAENLENIQQSLPANGAEGQAFAETFQQTINQLNNLSNKIKLAESGTKTQPENTSQALHGIAGLLQARGKIANLSVQSGKELPANSNSIVHQDINLNAALESLTHVVTQLDEMVEGGQDLTTKVEGLTQTVQGLKATITDHKQLKQSLNKIVENLYDLKQQTPEFQSLQVNEDLDLETISQELEQLNTQLDQQLMASDKQFTEAMPAADFFENLSTLESDKLSVEQNPQQTPANTQLSETIDNIEESISHIKEVLFNDSESADVETNSLENEIQTLATEVEIIQSLLPKQGASNENLKLSEKFSNRAIDSQIVEIRAESPDLNKNPQITEILTALGQPAEQQKVVSESQNIAQALQELNPESKKENILLRQIADEKNLSVANNIETYSLVKLESLSKKPEQEAPVLMSRQNDKQVISADLEFDLGNDKSSSKIATDFGMLNRAVNRENNAELPPMTKHFAHPEWNKEMGERVIWMHKQDIPSAELRLNPRHLGPVTIKVDVSNDQATVAFTAQHAAVKEAIESAIPKLKEMFSTQQLNLAEVNVSQDNPDQRQSRSFNQMGNNSENSNQNQDNQQAEQQSAGTVTDVTEEIETGRAIASDGILSIFA